MKTTAITLPSPRDSGVADFHAVFNGNNWRQKEILLIILRQMAHLKTGEHAEAMAQSIADYYVEVQAGRIK